MRRPESSAGIAALLLGAALLLAIVSYWPALNYGFTFDDKRQIVENPALTSWRYLPQYFTADVWEGVFPGVGGTYYRPLFLLWLRLNYVVFGLAPWGWHLTSVLAHLATVVMLFLVAKQWTGDGVIAGWASALFAVHPIHIETVAWVSGIPESLFALVGLGAIYCYGRYRRGGRWPMLAAAAGLYALALFMKETAIAIWPVMMIGDLWPRGDGEGTEGRTRWAELVQRQIPFALATVVYVDLRLMALHSLSGGTATHSWAEVLRAAPYLIIFYLRKMVWPSGLAVVYAGPELESFASPLFILPVITIAAVAVGAVLWMRKTRAVVQPMALAVLAMIPPIVGVSIFVRHDLAHDRYLYLPSAGLCILAAIAWQMLVRPGQEWIGGRWKWLGHGAMATAVLLLAVSLRAQEWPFHDNVSLFARAAKISPESPQAWGYLGEELMVRGKKPEAIEAFRRAQLLEPNGLLNNYRLAGAYYQAQEMDQAEYYFQKAIDRYHAPEVVAYDYALYRLALAQYAQNKMTAAETTLRRALRIRPNGTGYHVALGAVLMREGSLQEARLQTELELQIAPDEEARTQLREINAKLEAGTEGLRDAAYVGKTSQNGNRKKESLVGGR